MIFRHLISSIVRQFGYFQDFFGNTKNAELTSLHPFTLKP